MISAPLLKSFENMSCQLGLIEIEAQLEYFLESVSNTEPHFLPVLECCQNPSTTNF